MQNLLQTKQVLHVLVPVLYEFYFLPLHQSLLEYHRISLIKIQQTLLFMEHYCFLDILKFH